MRQFILGFSLCLATLVAGVAFSGPMTQNRFLKLPEPAQTGKGGACHFPPGGWTIVNCSNVAAATSAALNEWSSYVLQCGDDSRVATGDEATDVADANDGYLGAGDWLRFVTTDVTKYVSCLNMNVDSDCRYIECQ